MEVACIETSLTARFPRRRHSFKSVPGKGDIPCFYGGSLSFRAWCISRRTDGQVSECDSQNKLLEGVSETSAARTRVNKRPRAEKARAGRTATTAATATHVLRQAGKLAS